MAEAELAERKLAINNKEWRVNIEQVPAYSVCIRTWAFGHSAVRRTGSVRRT
jgi:hypothetical protein